MRPVPHAAPHTMNRPTRASKSRGTANRPWHLQGIDPVLQSHSTFASSSRCRVTLRTTRRLQFHDAPDKHHAPHHLPPPTATRSNPYLLPGPPSNHCHHSSRQPLADAAALALGQRTYLHQRAVSDRESACIQRRWRRPTGGSGE